MADLTDLEITKLCAEAMGLKNIHEARNTIRFENFFPSEEYNPLHDDAQAMALVKELRLRVHFEGAQYWYASDHIDNVCGESTNLNRAICLCAARVQIEKEKN